METLNYEKISALQTKEKGSEWRTKVQVNKQSVVPKVYVFFDAICDFFSPLACHHTTLLWCRRSRLHYIGSNVCQNSPLCRSQCHVIRWNFSKCMMNTAAYVNLQTENKNIIPDKWPLNLWLVSKKQILGLVHTFLRHNIIMTFLRPIPICTADWGYAHCWIKLVVFQW